MSELKYQECLTILDSFKCDFKKFPCFVETGSYIGSTITNVLEHFNFIHSIELSEKYYNYCTELFKNHKNVKLHFGDSGLILKDVLKDINENCIFFLDGHFSSGDTAQGQKDCPLLEELKYIMDLYKNEAIIIIDDYRLFGSHINEDWEDITKDNIKSIINSRLINWGECNDRLVIHLKNV